jgi:hypothetical protein
MQVSTRDGRIKVLGQEGVEGLLNSALLEPAHTQQLLFAQNRGGLVRLDQVCWKASDVTAGPASLQLGKSNHTRQITLLEAQWA